MARRPSLGLRALVRRTPQLRGERDGVLARHHPHEEPRDAAGALRRSPPRRPVATPAAARARRRPRCRRPARLARRRPRSRRRRRPRGRTRTRPTHVPRSGTAASPPRGGSTRRARMRSRSVEESVAQHQSLDALGPRDRVVELAQGRHAAAAATARRPTADRPPLQSLSRRLVGEADALRHHAASARGDGRGHRFRVPSVRMRSLPASCDSILRGSSAGGGRSTRARRPRAAPARPPPSGPRRRTRRTRRAPRRRRSRPRPLLAPRHRGHLVPGFEQPREEAAPDHAGRPRQEHLMPASSRKVTPAPRRTASP